MAIQLFNRPYTAIFAIMKTIIKRLGGMLVALTFYWYPNCGTCKKAKKWLDDHHIEYTSIHIVEETPSKQTILDLMSKSELSAKKFFNTSGKSYREKNIKDKIANASNEQMAEIGRAHV